RGQAAGEAEEQAQREAPERELVGDDVEPRVGHRDPEQDRAERGAAERLERGAVPPGHPGPEEAGGKLDQRILDRDPLAALPAPAAEQDPGDDGDVVVPRDAAPAAGAAGWRAHDGLVLRPAEDADVEEAPQHQAE